MSQMGSQMTPRGGKMPPRGRSGDQLGPGSEPDRSPGGVRVAPGAKKVDFGGPLGSQKGVKIDQNRVKSRKNEGREVDGWKN